MNLEQNSNLDVKKINSLDELFDDIDFKPVTDGLGFHGNQKAEEAFKNARQQVISRATPVRTQHTLEHPFTTHQRAINAKAPASDYVQSDLALFYGNEVPEDKAELIIEKPITTASNGIRLVAFVVDFIIVAAMTWLTFACITFLTDVDFAASLLEGHLDMMIVIGVMYLGYFILYFTILEKFQGGSIGKETLGLKVKTLSGKGPSLLRCFSRTVITLIGLFSLGLTTLVDLPGRITGTRVIKV